MKTTYSTHQVLAENRREVDRQHLSQGRLRLVRVQGQGRLENVVLCIVMTQMMMTGREKGKDETDRHGLDYE